MNKKLVRSLEGLICLLLVALITACASPTQTLTFADEEQIPQYATICSESQDKSPIDKPVYGKFLVIDSKQGSIDDVYGYLPEYLKATSKEEADYLICLEWGDEYLLGTYSSGFGSYNWYNSDVLITIVDLSNSQVDTSSFMDMSKMPIPGELQNLHENVHYRPTQEVLFWISEIFEAGKNAFFKDKPAQRIVSLDPNATEILFSIGAGKQIVGRSEDSVLTDEAKAITEIKYDRYRIDTAEGQPNLDLDQVASLAPDLVLADNTLTEEQIHSMSDYDTLVVTLRDPIDLEGVFNNIRTVAEYSGHLSETEVLITNLQARVAQVEEKVSRATERPKVLYEFFIDEGLMGGVVPGPNTIQSSIIRTAGGMNLGDVSGENYGDGVFDWRIIKEFPVAPDVILVLTGTPQEVAAREGWQAVPAVQSQRIYSVPYVGFEKTTRVVDILEEIAKLLHPEIFD